MEEGDEWKLNTRDQEWNEPNRVFLDEYASFLGILYNQILRPVVKEGFPLDRIKLSFLKKDLEGTIERISDYEINPETEDAYWNLRKVVNALNDLSDEETEMYKDVLNGLFTLNISCTTYGNEMNGIYKGRNPCRGSQYEFLGALEKLKIEKGNTNFLKSIESIFNTCKSCPYRK